MNTPTSTFTELFTWSAAVMLLICTTYAIYVMQLSYVARIQSYNERQNYSNLNQRLREVGKTWTVQ